MYAGDNTNNLLGVPIELILNFAGFHVYSVFSFEMEIHKLLILPASRSSLKFHSVHCMNFVRKQQDNPLQYLDELLQRLKDVLKWSDQSPVITTDCIYIYI